jgi:hypothetical protein
MRRCDREQLKKRLVDQGQPIVGDRAEDLLAPQFPDAPEDFLHPTGEPRSQVRTGQQAVLLGVRGDAVQQAEELEDAPGRAARRAPELVRVEFVDQQRGRPEPVRGRRAVGHRATGRPAPQPDAAPPHDLSQAVLSHRRVILTPQCFGDLFWDIREPREG